MTEKVAFLAMLKRGASEEVFLQKLSEVGAEVCFFWEEMRICKFELAPEKLGQVEDESLETLLFENDLKIQ